jgi:hypothetical protein
MVTSKTDQLKVADQCWVALAKLHKENPQRLGFRPEEILRRVQRDSAEPLRPGVKTHISAHNVANVPPNPGNYRMFFREVDGSYRLFRAGDPAHPARTGKIAPRPSDLPADLLPLLEWYEKDYCARAHKTETGQQLDPVLALLGVGKHLWQDESGDEFVRRERTGW